MTPNRVNGSQSPANHPEVSVDLNALNSATGTTDGAKTGTFHLRGERHSQCAACGRNFSSTGAFDKHRAWHPDDSTKPYPSNRRRICLDPATVKLKDRGEYWGEPPMTEQRKRERGWA